MGRGDGSTALGATVARLGPVRGLAPPLRSLRRAADVASGERQVDECGPGVGPVPEAGAGECVAFMAWATLWRFVEFVMRSWVFGDAVSGVRSGAPAESMHPLNT